MAQGVERCRVGSGVTDVSTHRYAHIMLGVPVPVQVEMATYLADDATRDDILRAVLNTLHPLPPEQICAALIAGVLYGIYLITADEDVDAGNITHVLSRWSSIIRVAAHTQRGLPVGVAHAATGELVGVPRFTLPALDYLALKAAWPVSFLDGSGKLLPPSRMHGQIDWKF